MQHRLLRERAWKKVVSCELELEEYLQQMWKEKCGSAYTAAHGEQRESCFLWLCKACPRSTCSLSVGVLAYVFLVGRAARPSLSGVVSWEGNVFIQQQSRIPCAGCEVLLLDDCPVWSTQRTSLIFLLLGTACFHGNSEDKELPLTKPSKFWKPCWSFRTILKLVYLLFLCYYL